MGWGYGKAKGDAIILTPNSLTRFALTGMTDGSAAALAPLARSYHQPPAVSIRTDGFQNEGFSVAERAFILTRTAGNAAAELDVSIAASADSPLVNPAFVVENWDGENVVVTLDGKPVPPGDACRVGFRETPTGKDLILWLKMTAESPTRPHFERTNEMKERPICSPTKYLCYFMKRFIQHTVWTTAMLLSMACTARATETLSLAGDWRFEIADTNAAGFAKDLPGKIKLPGTMDDAGLGPKNTKPPTLEGPYRLYDYAGPAWYQRDIEIPAAWEGKRVTLVPGALPLGHDRLARRQAHRHAGQPDRPARL